MRTATIIAGAGKPMGLVARLLGGAALASAPESDDEAGAGAGSSASKDEGGEQIDATQLAGEISAEISGAVKAANTRAVAVMNGLAKEAGEGGVSGGALKLAGDLLADTTMSADKIVGHASQVGTKPVAVVDVQASEASTMKENLEKAEDAAPKTGAGGGGGEASRSGSDPAKPRISKAAEKRNKAALDKGGRKAFTG